MSVALKTVALLLLGHRHAAAYQEGGTGGQPDLVAQEPSYNLPPYNFTKPWFCKGFPCPIYAVWNETKGYQTRIYKNGSFAGTVVEHPHYSPSVLLAKGLKIVEPYLKGHNLADEELDIGRPFVTGLFPTRKFHDAKDKYIVGYFLDTDFPPTPRDKRVFLKLLQPGERTFVKVVHKPLTKQGVLFEAVALAAALASDNVSFDPHKLGVAYYEESPTAITGIFHTEVFLHEPAEEMEPIIEEEAQE